MFYDVMVRVVGARQSYNITVCVTCYYIIQGGKTDITGLWNPTDTHGSGPLKPRLDQRREAGRREAGGLST